MSCRRALPGTLALLAISVMPTCAFAHASERAFILLLPTGFYLAAGTLVVALSFLFLVAAPVRMIRALGGWRLPLLAVPRIRATVPSCLSFLFLATLVAVGHLGPRSPLDNPLPTTIWTLWWVGFVLLQALLGDLWSLINPWVGPFRLIRRSFGLPDGLIPYPAFLGYAPAIAAFLAFAWLEIVDIAPADPGRLADAILVYGAITFLGLALFGEKAWLGRGEAFSVFLGLVARLSPFAVEDGRLTLAPPAARLAGVEPLPTSGVLLVLLTLATVTFDGLSHTHAWVAAAGINPLEFPGRSAVQSLNTAGLLGAWALLAGAFLLAVALGRRLAGGAGERGRSTGLLVLSILPISIGYHFAHYLTALLVNGQQALAAYARMLDLGHVHVTTSFLNDYYVVRLIWNLQAGAIVLCHMLAFLLAHMIALQEAGSRHQAMLGQLPLAILMIGYTLLGLWLLSTPAIG